MCSRDLWWSAQVLSWGIKNLYLEWSTSRMQLEHWRWPVSLSCLYQSVLWPLKSLVHYGYDGFRFAFTSVSVSGNVMEFVFYTKRPNLLFDTIAKNCERDVSFPPWEGPELHPIQSPTLTRNHGCSAARAEKCAPSSALPTFPSSLQNGCGS